jgi:hypothetical protein
MEFEYPILVYLSDDYRENTLKHYAGEYIPYEEYLFLTGVNMLKRYEKW